MALHMEEISKAVPEGRHAVVVMDGALWHQPSLDQDNSAHDKKNKKVC